MGTHACTISSSASSFILTGPPKSLICCQDKSWLVGGFVLKPTQRVELTEFCCRTHARSNQEQVRLLKLGSEEVQLFRVSALIPLPGTDLSSYVVDKWTVTHFLDGALDPTHRKQIEDILPAARGFYNVLETVVSTPCPSMLARQDRWTQVDRIACDASEHCYSRS